MNVKIPNSTRDLIPSERRLLDAMRHLRFGRFEFLQIRDGEVALDPWPTTVRDVKLGAEHSDVPGGEEFALKQQVSELFEYIRSVDAGEIRTLEVRHGLPFSMEVELSGKAMPGTRGGNHA